MMPCFAAMPESLLNRNARSKKRKKYTGTPPSVNDIQLPLPVSRKRVLVRIPYPINHPYQPPILTNTHQSTVNSAPVQLLDILLLHRVHLLQRRLLTFLHVDRPADYRLRYRWMGWGRYVRKDGTVKIQRKTRK